MRRITLAAIGAAALLFAAAIPAMAQGPMGHGYGPRAFIGNIPQGHGLGIMLMERDQDRDRIMLQLRLEDCEPTMLALLRQGRWRTFVPGAPDFVNAGFPGRFQSGDAFLVRCGTIRPNAHLTDADNGSSVTLLTGGRLRVTLESNASTGYSWVVTPTPNAAILAPVQDFYVPPDTDLLGAPGFQVFDFEAVGPGTVNLHLAYQRTTTPQEPPAQEWSASVTVQ